MSSPLAASSVQLDGERGSIQVSRPGPAVVLLRLGGRNVDDLTDALTQEIETDLVIQGAMHLFIDARASMGADVLGSPRWALWFRSNRALLARVSALVGAGFLKTTGELARGFAGLDGKLDIFLDPPAFERAQAAALRPPAISGTWMRGEDPATDDAPRDESRDPLHGEGEPRGPRLPRP